MDENEIIERLRGLIDATGVPSITADEHQRLHAAKNLHALRNAIQAIEALAKVRENIDAATAPADMIYALYAVTEPCANVNGPVQNCKVADMAAMVETDKWLDPETPIAEVDAELVRAGFGQPVATLEK
jgi:hypothetical protein